MIRRNSSTYFKNSLPLGSSSPQTQLQGQDCFMGGCFSR